MNKKNTKKNDNGAINDKSNTGLMDTTLGLASEEVVGRYGSAAGEYIKGYKGRIADSGKTVEKGLKQISESRVNENHRYSNLKQQAGFSAEVHYENRTNANNIINKSQNRISRTDNVGMVNHKKYDFLAVDTGGNPITDNSEPLWGAQMKFCGKYSTSEEATKSAQKLARNLAGDKWTRYRGNDVLVPHEQYDEIVRYSSQKSVELFEQAENERLLGNVDKANIHELKAKRFEQVSIDVEDSGFTSKEAMFLREHPKLSTAKYVTETSHAAGLEQAKAGAVISGSISTAQNIISIVNRDKELSEAIKDVAKDSATGAATSYVLTAGGTAAKGFMENSGKAYFENLSKANMPSMIATATVQIGKSLARYARGEIDALELSEELGEKGTGMVAASWGAAIGTAVFPGIGTAIGGMIGYMTSSMLYQSSMKTLKEARISEERRYKIRAILVEAKVEIERLQDELEGIINDFYSKREKEFCDSFGLINFGIINNDIDIFTEGLNKIAIEMGSCLDFKNFEEFNDFMMDENSILEF